MARVVLVHGAGHGGWCWRDVVPALEALGHAVGTVDLPSVAADPSGLEGRTLDDDARAILAALDRPAALVGHSAAGYAIARAAALAPAKVARLVYLCAYVPAPGVTITDHARAAPGRPLDGALQVDRASRAYRFNDAALAANLYDDCPAVIDEARDRLGWQAIGPQRATVDPPVGIRSDYIVCSRDRTIPPAQQRAMAAGLGGASIHAFPSGHSPFFAAPAALADLLGQILRVG